MMLIWRHILQCHSTNLEAMKISAYYKQRREIVILSPGFTPERTTKFFYRKDYDDGKYPINLGAPNVRYGGLAFSDNVYEPLPLEVERMRPDTSLYSKMEHRIRFLDGYPNQKRDKIFRNLTEGEHCRLSLDGKTIWPEYNYQFKYLPSARNIFFHDYDLAAIDGSYDVIQDILSRARTDGWATKVGMKFPVKVRSGQELWNWSSLNPNSTFFFLEYDGIIDPSTFQKWAAEVKQRAIYRLDYNCTAGDLSEKDFLHTGMLELYHQALISRSYGLPFALIYDESFFTDKQWCDVLDMMTMFGGSGAGMRKVDLAMYGAQDTMRDYIWWCSEIGPTKPAALQKMKLTPARMRETFSFVRQHHMPLFKDMCSLSVKDLGGWT